MSTTVKEAVEVVKAEIGDLDSVKESKVVSEFLNYLTTHLYVMIYVRDGNRGFKLFLHDGNRASAIERAKQHCLLTARKHILTLHAIHDIALEEQNILEGKGTDFG